jgi:hypothetical protein
MCCSPFFPCPSYNLAWTNQDPLLKMLKMSVCSGFATVSEVGLDPKDLVIACTVYWPRQSHFISAQAERGPKKEKKLKLSVIRKVDPVASSGSDFRERVSFPIPVYIQGSRILLLPLLFNLLYPSISEERRVDTNGSGPPFGIPSPRHDFPLDRHSLASPRQPRLLTPAMDTATPTQTFTPAPTQPVSIASSSPPTEKEHLRRHRHPSSSSRKSPTPSSAGSTSSSSYPPGTRVSPHDAAKGKTKPVIYGPMKVRSTPAPVNVVISPFLSSCSDSPILYTHPLSFADVPRGAWFFVG